MFTSGCFAVAGLVYVPRFHCWLTWIAWSNMYYTRSDGTKVVTPGMWVFMYNGLTINWTSARHERSSPWLGRFEGVLLI